jgi:hypothetical protein
MLAGWRFSKRYGRLYRRTPRISSGFDRSRLSLQRRDRLLGPWEKSLRERHGRTILAGLSPFVTRILETTGLLRELRHASSVPAAIQEAIIAKAARDASTEHTIEGRLYRISPKSTESCDLELWGDYQQLSDNSRIRILDSARPVASDPCESGKS